MKDQNEPFGTDEREERLCGLLNCLVKCLRGRVAVLAEDLVLCKEHSLCKKKIDESETLRFEGNAILTHEYHPSTKKKKEVVQ